MALTEADLSDMQRAVRDTLRRHWKLLMFHGIATLVLGLCALIAPMLATLAIDILIGWLFLLSGIAGLIAAFSSRDIPGFLWTLVTAALSVALGVLLVWRPAEGVATLTLALTALFVAEGVFQIVTSVAYRNVVGASWGWMLFSGLCDLVLVAVIVSGWPGTAAWAIGLIVGVNLITSGWAIIAVALQGRAIGRALFDDRTRG